MSLTLPSRRKGKNNQEPLFSGTNIDEVGSAFWLTPPDLLAKLHQEFNFDFDAAPFPRPAGYDSLQDDWGQRTWVNPPIGNGHSLSKWVNKAVEETKQGKTVVMFLPFPRWFRKLVQVDAEFRFPGPTYFLSPQGKKAKSEGGGRIPDIIVVMRPKP